MCDFLIVLCIVPGRDVLQKSDGCVETAGLIEKVLNAQVHFEKGEALLYALLKCKSHIVSGMLAVYIGIAVHSHLVAEFAAEQLPERYAPCLACQIPEGDFDAAYAAALTRMSAELLNSSEELVNVTGVFTDKS